MVRRGNFNGSIASLAGCWDGGPLVIARRWTVDLNIVVLEKNFQVRYPYLTLGKGNDGLGIPALPVLNGVRW